MSDINIILDGVIAFIAAALLGLVFLLAIVICWLYGRAKARRKKERLSDQSIWPHLTGLSLSLICSIAVMLLIVFTDRMPRPHALNRWLDDWLWVWIVAAVGLWPLGAYLQQKRRRKRSGQSASNTSFNQTPR